MKKRSISTITALLVLALLSGCGSAAPDAEPVAVPAEVMAADTVSESPAETVTAPTTQQQPPAVETVTETAEESVSENSVSENTASVSEDAIPAENTHVRVIPENFTPELLTFGPIQVMSDVTELDISGVNVTGIDMDTLIDSLPYLERLTMLRCGLNNDGYAQLQDRHPETRIIWEIVTYNGRWRIRTDTVAFSTLKDVGQTFVFLNRDAYYLRYCTDMVALDLGHNYVSDLSFLQYMPELKILILVDNWRFLEDGSQGRIADISDLKYCPKLRYLEFFCNRVADISVLAELKELEDLNISYNPITSTEALRDLPNLKRLWMEHTQVPYEEFEELQALYPDVEMVYYGTGSVDQGWRSGERYYAMRRMVRNNIIDELYAEPAPETTEPEATEPDAPAADAPNGASVAPTNTTDGTPASSDATTNTDTTGANTASSTAVTNTPSAPTE